MGRSQKGMGRGLTAKGQGRSGSGGTYDRQREIVVGEGKTHRKEGKECGLREYSTAMGLDGDTERWR